MKTLTVIKKIVYPALVSSILMMPLMAQEEAKEPDVMVLTVEKAVQYAKEYSNTLKSSDLELALARWEKYTAWNVFLPDLSVSGTLSRANKFSDPMASASGTYKGLGQIFGNIPGMGAVGAGLTQAGKKVELDETESRHWTAVGNIGISWKFNAAMIQNMRNTIAAYEAGEISWEQTQKNTELTIRKLFYGILLAQENVQIQKQSLENARQRMTQAETNYKNGYTPELSLLQTQVSYENQKPAVEKLEQQLNQQLGSFAILIGLPEGTQIKLDGKIEPVFTEIDRAKLLDMYEDSNLEIASLKQQIKSLKLKKSALDLSSYTPSLSLGWSYSPTSISSDGALDMKWDNEDNWRDTGNFNATLVWNITNMLPGSANRNNARTLSTNIEKLELKLDSLRKDTALQINTAVDTLEQARASIESSERNIRLAQRSYDMTVTAYRNGTRELLDVRDAETQLNQAKLSLATEGYNYISAILDLEYKLNSKISVSTTNVKTVVSTNTTENE